ncbi:hypothetical protein LCY76_08165 [Fictibacillus sp. KIGAM418]|uniref:Uncharacterized protein n=1 Tax=Fictibacillus marinisediminis TaxID=2878389 RepID=A0A9X1X9L9_9BACL|nr:MULTISPECIES: hypothetical protein [Fictibacillus]MCK6256566.1 hypothetical protein [Fictibacillus marinisediminis]MED2972028.1 hypothetical protein [Fictibacillus sp. B-59209]UZJ77554.1 hypothetical protein OKX00_15415 [Fictibacillus sp. KU28468]
MDENRITFYVNPKGEINTLPADESMHLFEIRANEAEIEQLRGLFRQLHEHNKKEGKDIFSTKSFFYENQGELDRKEDNEIMFEIYRQIFMLGTEKTKEDVEEMGVIPKLNELR